MSDELKRAYTTEKYTKLYHTVSISFLSTFKS